MGSIIYSPEYIIFCRYFHVHVLFLRLCSFAVPLKIFPFTVLKNTHVGKNSKLNKTYRTIYFFFRTVQYTPFNFYYSSIGIRILGRENCGFNSSKIFLQICSLNRLSIYWFVKKMFFDAIVAVARNILQNCRHMIIYNL